MWTNLATKPRLPGRPALTARANRPDSTLRPRLAAFAGRPLRAGLALWANNSSCNFFLAIRERQGQPTVVKYAGRYDRPARYAVPPITTVNATFARDALGAYRPSVTLRALRPHRAGLATDTGFAALALRPGIASVALQALRPHGTGFALRAGGANVTLRADRPNFTLRPLRACVALNARLAALALGTRRPRLATLSALARRPLSAHCADSAVTPVPAVTRQWAGL